MWCLVVMSWPGESVVTRVLWWFLSRFAEPQIPPWEMSWKWRMKALLIIVIIIITLMAAAHMEDFCIPWSPLFISGVQNPPGLCSDTTFWSYATSSSEKTALSALIAKSSGRTLQRFPNPSAFQCVPNAVNWTTLSQRYFFKMANALFLRMAHYCISALCAVHIT